MDQLVQLSKAMSDLNRLKILTLIQRETSLCVCELSDTLDLSQPLVSRHLKQLKEIGVLESHKEGKWTIYSITKAPSLLLNCYLKTVIPYEKNLGAVVSCKIRD